MSYAVSPFEPQRTERAILAPQPIPAAKNASFAAKETSGQKTTENMTAKAKNMTAVNTEPR